jgi:RimJ/RimL family protein N-acetyltransferase
MTYPYWPLFDLRLTSQDLVLRPMREADRMTIAEMLPDDVELDPNATTFAVEDPDLARGIASHQSYWEAYGTWRPESWRLSFAVFADGDLIGAQQLEANDFATLRTVDTSSFLFARWRGRGFGKQMRQAVLGLAFGPMAARAAISSAWHDNRASLAISHALGYQPNGESLHRRGDGVDVMKHMRLLRADWERTSAGPLAIDAFEPCRPLFGLGG